MLLKRLVLPIALMSMSGGAFAGAVSTASITVQNLTISADQGFVLSSDGGTVSAAAGPDSFGNASTQAFPILGATSADAAIATAIAHAGSSIPLLSSGLVTSITLAGNINASSSVTLGGTSWSQSLGAANPAFDLRAPGASATNPVHLTFSMTMYGSIGGAADPGSYISEVMAEFGFGANNVSFDLPLSGPPPNAPLLILDPVTFTGTATLFSSDDVFFQALAQAQSSATGAPEPLTLSLFGAGLLGTVALRRRKRGLAGPDLVISIPKSTAPRRSRHPCWTTGPTD